MSVAIGTGSGGGRLVKGAMREDLYILARVGAHRVAESKDSTPNRVRAELTPKLQAWGGEYLEDVAVSGSYAKGTAIRSVSLGPADVDVDLLASLAPGTPGALAEQQASLCEALREYQPRIANVSVRMLVGNTRVDVVAGRRWAGSTDYTLWQARSENWVKTNLTRQIEYVRGSGCLDEILAVKIWRRRQAVYFPSYCLELGVIEALQGSFEGLGTRVIRVLEWLARELPGANLRDPGNPSNVVSELMTSGEKWAVAHAARMSLGADNWSEIV